jgi:hypothetical protein
MAATPGSGVVRDATNRVRRASGTRKVALRASLERCGMPIAAEGRPDKPAPTGDIQVIAWRSNPVPERRTP